MQHYDNDAMGHALLDFAQGKADRYVVEREDGLVDVGQPELYFTGFPEWSPLEQKFPRYVQGRVLDVGCGAGRHALYLQSLGHEVVAIDRSPLAIEVAKTRGVQNARAVSIDDDHLPRLGKFQSIIMMGHNIGLLHSREEGRRILRHFADMATTGATIVGTSRNPEMGVRPEHTRYQEWNLERGRMRGQIHLRIRHRLHIGDWLDYLILSPEELAELAHGTGWELISADFGNVGFGDGSYLAVLRKK